MQEIGTLTKSLIQIPSVHSEPEEIVRCSEFIEDWLNGYGIRYQRLNHEGIPSILVMPDSGKVPVLLMSHFDVVEGNEDLFLPYIEDGKLYGRGALDDKYAVALSLVLLKNHVIRNRSRRRDQDDLPFGILLTGDEEMGGENGANRALSSIESDFCVVLDGGNSEEIVTKEKGILQVKLVSKGKASHGARPWLGENAIEKLMKDYQIIKTFFNNTEPDNWHRTLNISRINAGNSYNKVPDYAEAVLDIRYTENDNIDHLLAEIGQAIKSKLVLIRKEPLFVAKPSPYLDLLIKTNPGLKTVSEHGSSDARFLSKHGMNGIVWGADGDLSHHSVEEHVNLDSVLSLYQRIDRFVSGCWEMKKPAA